MLDVDSLKVGFKSSLKFCSNGETRNVRLLVFWPSFWFRWLQLNYFSVNSRVPFKEHQNSMTAPAVIPIGYKNLNYIQGSG